MKAPTGSFQCCCGLGRRRGSFFRIHAETARHLHLSRIEPADLLGVPPRLLVVCSMLRRHATTSRCWYPQSNDVRFRSRASVKEYVTRGHHSPQRGDMRTRLSQSEAIAIPIPRARLIRRCSSARTGRPAACRPRASSATSFRPPREVTGRSSARRSMQCFVAARPLTRTRFGSSDGHVAGRSVCTRRAGVARARPRIARCFVGSSPSTAVASAQISFGIHSACVSTSSPSSGTSPRDGAAALSNAARLKSRGRCAGIRSAR